MNASKYYMPYDSEEDTDKDTDENTDDGSDSDDSENRMRDPRYAIIRTAGPNFSTSAQQLQYMEHAPGSAYDVNTNITSLSSLIYLNPPKTTKTSLFSIKSTNRDLNVWSSPFNFQLKTPRVYKDVTKFQLVQISFPNNTQTFTASPAFLSSFVIALIQYGLPESCISTCINITGCVPGVLSLGTAEYGRQNSDGNPLMNIQSIESGHYSKPDLAKALTINANNTPPFNRISYDAFKAEFQTTRDISILFNEPGDYYYSNVSKVKLGRHTKNDILNTYYSQKYIDSLTCITDTIAFNAYYYPVLKELLATNKSLPFLNTGIYSYSQVANFVLGQFLGLTSDIYYTLCSTNRGSLDNFRKQHTFEYKNINKYIWSYNEDQRRFSCIHNSLHTSLQNDILNKYHYLLNTQLLIQGLNTKSFQSLKSCYSQSNSIFNHLESNLSTVLFNFILGGNYNYTGGINHITSSGIYNAVTDLHADGSFTSMFNYSSTFGQQFYGNYSGSNFIFTNFLDYHSTISSYYCISQSTNNTVSTIYGCTNNNHHMYVSTKYNDVIPQYIIDNKSYLLDTSAPVMFIANQITNTPGQSVSNLAYTDIMSTCSSAYSCCTAACVDPICMSTCSTNYSNCISTNTSCQEQCCAIIEQIVTDWYSCLPVNSVTQNLGYRMGLPVLNFANFNLLSTVFSVTSTTNFNLYLQINEEQSFNNMDVAMDENYSISNETTGQVKLMAAKILMQGIGTGEVSETAIQNPILFDAPLGKVDRLNLKIYADDDNLTPMWLLYPFDIGVNEWDATFQIDEEVAYADRNSGWGNNPTIPIPNNPAAFQYMALTSAANPNNK